MIRRALLVLLFLAGPAFAPGTLEVTSAENLAQIRAALAAIEEAGN